MSRQRILVVEDEPAIADTIVYALAPTASSPNGAPPAALQLTRRAPATLHWQYSTSGCLIKMASSCSNSCSNIGTGLPAIFLTARSSEIDKVVGLELGADDYIAKPFSPRELVARVRTVLRRVQRSVPNAAAAASAAGFDIDDERKTIRLHGRALDLSRTEYRLLKVLIERPGRVFSRDELMERAWDDPASAFDRTVDAHVKALRAKLREAAPRG